MPSEQDDLGGRSRGGRLRLKPTNAEVEQAERDRRARKAQRAQERRKRDERSRSGRYYEAAAEGSEEEARRERKRARKERRRREELSGQARDRGPTRKPHPRFGDDLLRAERVEAEERSEREWAHKLADLASEDFSGQGEFGRMPGAGPLEDEQAEWEAEMEMLQNPYGATGSGIYGAYIPKRWRDQTTLPVRLEELDDEGYAEAMRRGMYERTHASEIAAGKARAEIKAKEKARLERELAEEKAKHDERVKERKRKQEAEALKNERETLQRLRSEWEAAWEKLKVDSAGAAKAPPLYFSDLPWPTAARPLKLEKSEISRFLFGTPSASQKGSDESSAAADTKRLRTALMRYHPDRFYSAPFFARVPEAHRDQIRECVNRVSQVLAELQSERREAKK